MSKILTRSKFFWGTTVTINSRSIDFDEGGSEIMATMRVGAYSATQYVAEFQRALRLAGTQDYICTLDRATRQMTVEAPLPFTLRTNTGTRIASSAYPMAGFTTVADLTGDEIVGVNGVGEEYLTQYPVDKYLDPDDNIQKEQGTVNATPEGVVAQVEFGDVPRAEMNIQLITNILTIQNQPFGHNATGVADFKAFMAYIMLKGRVEFMKDMDTPELFFTCYLESTADDKDALRWKIKNMNPDIYESGKLTFRKVIA